MPEVCDAEKLLFFPFIATISTIGIASYLFLQFPCGSFYGKTVRTRGNNVIIPSNPNISDDDDFDDDDQDPDYEPEPHLPDIPSASNEPPVKKRRTMPVFEEEDVTGDEDDDEAEEQQSNVKGNPKRKKGMSSMQARPTTWKKIDIHNAPLPNYVHQPPLFVESPVEYFNRFFSLELIKHITYQTNLYATQKDINTTFNTNEKEIQHFVAILLYMGIVTCPSLDDYWALDTRVTQVAELMSSKRFRLLRRTLHFNDNSQAHGSIDRFYKVRPLFTHINTAFRRVPQTAKQSIDEVMVAYKGKTAGNLRQYIKNKPDKWGFKLFSRASEDGFIHDMILYQGASTIQAHGIPLSSEQEELGATSQIVTVLASTMPDSTTNAIFADNFFTSLEVVRYLKSKNCRYTGTARENRIGKPPLMPVKDMGKANVPRGTFDYMTTDDGIMALRWKDNKVVTMLSNDLGVEPVSSCSCYSKETKKREDVICPNVIKSYNANMGGIDKSDMLVHLYKTPLKSKRWHMRLFAYCVDLSLCNAWLLYKRDCHALQQSKSISLKDFRLEVFKGMKNCNSSIQRRQRTTETIPGSSSSFQLPVAVRGQCSQGPDKEARFDTTLEHLPVYVKTRQTCKNCSRQSKIIRSNIMCKICKVHLCLNGERNCFMNYHEAVA